MLIFMLNAISFLLFSFRTCQRGPGPGTDAGADHSDGVSEQNEGASKQHSVVQMQQTHSKWHKRPLPYISLKPEAYVNCSVCTC